MSLERLANRVRHLVGVGKVRRTDDAGGVQLAQVDLAPGGGARLWDKAKVMGQFGLATRVPAGGDAVAVFLGGDPTNGVIIATGHAQYRLVGLGEGEVALYDQSGNVVHLADGAMTLKHTTKIRLETPRLECTGDIVDRCDAGGSSLATLRTAFNAHHHLFVKAGLDVSGASDHTVG